MSATRLAPGPQQERLAAYLDGLAQAAGHADRVIPLKNYCTGLLLEGERKSVEPMAARLVPDEAVKSCFVAGGPEECRDQIVELMDHAARLDFGQVCFAKLGPDYEEAITLLRREVLDT